jgi:hypothetical protein
VTFGDKIKLVEAASSVAVNLKTVVGAIAVTLFFFFGVILALATNYWPTSLVVAALFFVVGFGIIVFIARNPETIVQKLEVSGEMKAAGLKCPNCGASVDASRFKMISGVPYQRVLTVGTRLRLLRNPNGEVSFFLGHIDRCLLSAVIFWRDRRASARVSF